MRQIIINFILETGEFSIGYFENNELKHTTKINSILGTIEAFAMSDWLKRGHLPL
jgi:hypothetical protein